MIWTSYSPQSLQALTAGQIGLVTRLYNDSYLLAEIAGQLEVLLNLDFVEDVRP